MDLSKFFNLRERLIPNRLGGILVLITIFPILAITGAADSKSQADKDLAEVLEKAANYCDQLQQTFLHFVCKEDVQEKINVPYSKDYRKSIYWTSDKAGGAYRKGQSKHYIYEYQLIQGNIIQESRVLLQEDNQKRYEENAPLKTKRFYHRLVFLGPVGLLSREAQKKFDYKLSKWGKDTLVVETTPKSDSQPDQLFRKIWLDRKDGSIKKIEWKNTSLKNFQELKKDAEIYKAFVQLYFFSEYKIQRNGLRFPSTYYIREQYSGKTFQLEGRLYPENKILRSEIKVKYMDYKFFESEAEKPTQSRPIQTAEKENPTHTFPQISLRLITGGSYLSGGDINHGIDGFFRYLNTQGFVDVTSPAPGALHYGYSAEWAFQIAIGKRFGLELEAGYEAFSTKLNIESTWRDVIIYDDTFQPKVYIIPLSLNFYYNFPLTPRFNLQLTAGPGWYFGTIQWGYQMARRDNMSLLKETWEANPRALAFQGGLGIEMKFARHWALVVDVMGRIGKFKNMTGPFTQTYSSYNQAPSTENDASIWYYEHRDPVTGETFPMLEFDKDQPYGVSPGSLRKAELDFSGFSLRVGFRFTFK